MSMKNSNINTRRKADFGHFSQLDSISTFCCFNQLKLMRWAYDNRANNRLTKGSLLSIYPRDYYFRSLLSSRILSYGFCGIPVFLI